MSDKEHKCQKCGHVWWQDREQPACQRCMSADIETTIAAEQSAADDLYRAACTLMRYKSKADWLNLENAAHRFNAAMQARRNSAIIAGQRGYSGTLEVLTGVGELDTPRQWTVEPDHVP